MQTREIKVGTKFKHMKEEWICTSNDGFIFEADCLNKNCPMKDLMLIGSSEEDKNSIDFTISDDGSAYLSSYDGEYEWTWEVIEV